MIVCPAKDILQHHSPGCFASQARLRLHQDRSDEVNSTLGVELRFDRVFLWQSMSLGFEVRLNPAFGLRMVCKDAAIRRTTSLTLTKISRVALIVVRLSILYLLTRPQHCSLK